ncbi:MAG: hypothetical protein JJU28_03525 [Cyclobacteriaceae bacterium]|nr:hypothetical protein [Cyclobacteriaceae bacterium]
MKNTYLIFAFAWFVLAGCNPKPSDSTEISSTVKADLVEVIDFHSTHRCITCVAIEKTSKKVVEESFVDELKTGKVIFRVLNIDDPENKEIVKEYEIYGSSLVLIIHRGDNKRAEDLTQFAFMNIRNEEAFSEGLKEKIRNFL